MLEDSLHVDRKRKEGLVVVFSLGSLYVEMMWCGELSEKTTTKRKQPDFRFQFRSAFRFKTNYKIANKIQQELYFATILDLKHQRTPLSTREVHIFENERLGLL